MAARIPGVRFPTVILGATLAVGFSGCTEVSSGGAAATTDGKPAAAAQLPDPLVGTWQVQESTGEAGPITPWFDQVEISSLRMVFRNDTAVIREDRYHLEEGRDADGHVTQLIVRDSELPWMIRQRNDRLWLIEDATGGYTYVLRKVVTSRG